MRPRRSHGHTEGVVTAGKMDPMPSSMRDPWFVTGVLANLALGVVLAGLVLAPMYMALKWWIAHHHGLR